MLKYSLLCDTSVMLDVSKLCLPERDLVLAVIQCGREGDRLAISY